MAYRFCINTFVPYLSPKGCTVEVFGRRSWRAPSTLWSYITKAPVLALLTEYVYVDSTSEGAYSGESPVSVSLFACFVFVLFSFFGQKTRPEND